MFHSGNWCPYPPFYVLHFEGVWTPTLAHQPHTLPSSWQHEPHFSSPAQGVYFPCAPAAVGDELTPVVQKPHPLDLGNNIGIFDLVSLIDETVLTDLAVSGIVLKSTSVTCLVEW